MTNPTELLADRLEAGSALYDPQDRKLAVAALRAFASPPSDVDTAKIGRDSANRIMALRHAPPSDVGGRSDMAPILENLDELDKQRTPGPWKKTHDNVTAPGKRSLVARCDADWSGFKVDMAKASKNARFITALENAWPKIRAALRQSTPSTGQQDEREAIALECKADMYALWCDSCNAHPSACPLLSRSPAPGNGAGMREALKLARKRIEYFGDITDQRHREANEQYFFPPIDAALAAVEQAPGGGVDRDLGEILLEALMLGRDAVMESFGHAKDKDDQLLADMRLQSIDGALAELEWPFPDLAQPEQESAPASVGVLREDSTCYLERSKVREILIGQPDENLHITEHILFEVDALPIFTAADLAALSESKR